MFYRIGFPFAERSIFPVLVVDGAVRPGMKANIDGHVIEIDRIEAEHRKWDEATPGQEVYLIVKGGSEKLIRSLEGREIEFL